MDASLDHLAKVVRQAVDGFHDKYEAWAQILHWPVDAVKKNPGHARDLVTMTMARNAVVYHPASPATSAAAHRQPPRSLSSQPPSAHAQQPRPALGSRLPNAWDKAFETGKTWVQQGWQNLEHTARHPILATAEAIDKNRIVHTGNRYLDRAVDIVGGSQAGFLAHSIYYPAEILDLAIRYGPGKSPFVDSLIKRGVLRPGRPFADRASDVAAPLSRQAALRPPKTIPGKILAATPDAAVLLLTPLPAAIAYAGMHGVGSAYDRARQTHAPAGPKTDAGILGSGLAEAGAAALQLRALYGPEAANLISVMPEQAQGEVLDWVWRTAVKSGLGGAVGGAYQATDNAIAKATYDPNRARLQGVGTSALIAGMTAASFGVRDARAYLPDPAPGIVRNRAYGKRWEIDGAELHLEPYQHSLQAQPMIVSLGPSKLRARADFLGIDIETGKPMLSEMKASPTAKLTNNQKIVFKELETFGGRLVGKARLPYEDDRQLPPMAVNIYRKTNP